MAEPKEQEFLDDIADVEAEQDADEMIDIDEAAAEFDEIDALRAERDEYKDRFMRALADAENSRKRADKDRKEAENYGGSKLARDLLPVYDNMKRAIEAAGDEQREAAAALIEGVELTMRELLNVFSKHGITIIAPRLVINSIPFSTKRCLRPCARNKSRGHYSGVRRRVHVTRPIVATRAGWRVINTAS